MKYRWARPELPETQAVRMITVGFVMLAGSIIALIGSSFMLASIAPQPVELYQRFGLSAPADSRFGWILVNLASYAGLPISVLLLSLGVIVKEIRHMAFEAAIRHGDAVPLPSAPNPPAAAPATSANGS